MTRIIPTKSSKAHTTTLKSVLSHIQLEQYLSLFQGNEIDLTTLNEQSLKSIGIKNDSHRKALLKYIRKLQQILTTARISIENNDNSMSLEEIQDDGLMKVSIDEHNLAILTPITEEEEPGLPDVSETSDGVNDVTQTNNEEAEVTVKNKNSQVSEQVQDEVPTNEIQPNSSSRDEDDIPTSRARKHFSTDNEDLLLRRQRGAVARDTNWRLSMPVTNNELSSPCNGKLPSYYDVVNQEYVKAPDDEELPPYFCSVRKSGYIFKKNEFSSKGYRSRDRSWKKVYLYLWGTLLRVYKSEPIDINRISPVYEFSMQNVQIGLAKDYSKRSNVIRVRIPTGSQFLIQVQNQGECVEWIEKLQSSANISTTIDEREMPMFITLPMRRRRIGMPISSTTSLTSMNSINYEGGISIINNSAIPISASGLTFQQFNEIARELQQVQITEALPQQQLSW